MVPGQRSLFASGDPAIDRDASWHRVDLGGGSWVDLARGYLRGADTLLDELIARVAWRSGRRPMYDRIVDDPRLSYRFGAGEPAPHPELARVRAELTRATACRSASSRSTSSATGATAWRSTATGSFGELDDTIVAILTLGACRPFRIRPSASAGARSRDLAPASGDLLVMGGTCQREWEHGVPKIARAGPRVSAMWRWARR